jgi:hypothetical protein
MVKRLVTARDVDRLLLLVDRMSRIVLDEDATEEELKQAKADLDEIEKISEVALSRTPH